jgi:hypothetical protein
MAAAVVAALEESGYKVSTVLHADDAVANKVCALFGRALPRDFADALGALTQITDAAFAE